MTPKTERTVINRLDRARSLVERYKEYGAGWLRYEKNRQLEAAMQLVAEAERLVGGNP